MNNLLERLKEKLDSMTDKEKDDIFESITHTKFKTRWISKLNNLNLEKRSNIIEKIILKYESDNYIKREYKIGYEPRTSLYWLLYDYSLIYGKRKLPVGDFVTESFFIDDIWYLERLDGQGSVIRISKNIPELKTWLVKDKDGVCLLFQGRKPERINNHWEGSYMCVLEKSDIETDWEQDPIEVSISVSKI